MFYSKIYEKRVGKKRSIDCNVFLPWVDDGHKEATVVGLIQLILQSCKIKINRPWIIVFVPSLS